MPAPTATPTANVFGSSPNMVILRWKSTDQAWYAGVSYACNMADFSHRLGAGAEQGTDTSEFDRYAMLRPETVRTGHPTFIPTPACLPLRRVAIA